MGADVSTLCTPQQKEELKRRWGEDIDGILNFANTCFSKLLSAGSGGNLNKKEFEKAMGILACEPNFVSHTFEVWFFFFFLHILSASQKKIIFQIYFKFVFLNCFFFFFSYLNRIAKKKLI